jgi:adenine-specific DNA-methyltransferase
MKLKIKTLEQAIESKKELKTIAPDKDEIIRFKKELKTLVGKLYDIDNRIDDETEEHLKTDLRDFLTHSVYSRDEYAINTKGKIDLAIYLGNTTNEKVGVIIEAKRPKNKSEMISFEDLNKKAFHELVLYYFDERIKHNNSNLKYLIITNVLDWYLIDVNNFENKIFNKKLKDEYEKCKNDEKKNPYFYEEAKKIISSIDYELPCIHFNIKEYEEFSKKDTPANRKKIINLYKVLSPNFLLKKQLANDSNKLNTNFYKELLHIIGVEEVPEGGKKVIKRKEIRDNGSFLENAINILETEDSLRKFTHLYPECKTKEDKIYTIALELVLTWVNRILFLKLLEGQLLSYHKENQNDFKFLNPKKINDFDEMYKLFHQVLARNYNERPDQIKEKYKFVPYLNSSLFEISEIEDLGIKINSLDDNLTIPVFDKTKTGFKGHKLNPLEYLLEFLNAYTFGGNQNDDYESDELINASVLGNIFEKINGYKDGSFYTPGFITQYMCKETIERAVVQKFNEFYTLDCKNLTDVVNERKDKKEVNELINSIKICDPAVGSGHFLVSALNTMIATKQYLGVLRDKTGKDLRDYTIEVVNDELVIFNEDGSNFKYRPHNKESQRIQETLFHEKQTVIENCLFGVDINSNSVKICRLRLWIELLKNAYYIKGLKSEPDYLETLPNIDINIKCGNSLISRFGLDADLKEALKKSSLSIDTYKNAVSKYKNAVSKSEKRELEQVISEVKNNFKSTFDGKIRDRLSKIIGEYENEKNRLNIVEQLNGSLKKAEKDNLKKLKEKSEKAKQEKEGIIDNKIFINAFEWRFEFPEVLNNEGEFVGFDVVIGNPPYIDAKKIASISTLLKEKYKVYYSSADLSSYFFELGVNVLKSNGIFSFINTNKFFKTEYGKPLKRFISDYKVNSIINFEQVPIFDEALVSSLIIVFEKNQDKSDFIFVEFNKEASPNNDFERQIETRKTILSHNSINEDSWSFSNQNESQIIAKIYTNSNKIKDIVSIDIKRGVTTGFDPAFIINSSDYNSFIEINSSYKNIIKPLLKGKEIKKYYNKRSDLFLLFIDWHFPLQNKNKSFEENEKEFFNVYEDLYNHLLKYKKELSARNKEETGIRYEWYALQRCAASYFENFDKTKIVWPLTASNWGFALDTESHYLSSGGFILITEELNINYLLAILNSNLMKYLFSKIGVMTAGGAFTLKKATIDEFPIKEILTEQQKPFIEKVDQILALKNYKPDADTSALEREIDFMVYKLYGLTYEEVLVIDTEFIMNKNDYENK